MRHHITVADLPAPYATISVGFGPRGVPRPDGADVAVPPGFTAKIFASGLRNPRYLRIAPNGDIFLAETGADRIHVFRAADGADTPAIDQVYAEGMGLNRPFGLAFYPPDSTDPAVALRRQQQLHRPLPLSHRRPAVSDLPQIIVPQLCTGHGGHSTRDVAFSPDGKRMFISIGSGSNIADGMRRMAPDEIQAWEAAHGVGASWDAEANRADIV